MTSTPDLRGVHLWLVLSRANRSVESAARASVEALGLCLSDFGVLEALLHKGPQSAGALGGMVLLTSGSMTSALDRLERRGLVERRVPQADRRAREIHLTPPGRTLIRRLFAQHERDMEAVFAHLSSPERAWLAETLKKLGRREVTK